MSVSYDVIDVFAEKGKLVLTDGKLSTNCNGKVEKFDCDF